MTGHPKPSKGIESMRLADERIHARTLLPRVLADCAEGRFHPEAVTSRIVPPSEAAEGILDPAPKTSPLALGSQTGPQGAM